MCPHLAIALGLCLPTAALSAASQEMDLELKEATQQQALDLLIERNRVYVTQRDDSTWIRGATYKAEISPTGFTYIPFLGSSAPKNYPVRFRLESAMLGSQALDLTPRATVSKNGNRFVLDRGAVDVIYDVDVSQVEQSFAVNAAGADVDLTLELSVDTNLLCNGENGGFCFSGEYGGMTYGAATVLDGAGRSASVPARLKDGSLTLTVPATFLESATGTVLVDPILTTFTVDDFTTRSEDADVAYDDSNDAFIYVFEDYFSDTDVDIFSVVVSPAGTQLDSGFALLSDDATFDPSVAGLNSANQALVVALLVPSAGGFESIVGTFYDFAAEIFSSSLIEVTRSNGATVVSRPDVGGNSSPTPGGSYAVVWQGRFVRDADIFSIVVDPDGTVSSFQTLMPGPDHDATRPAISKSTGDPSVYGMWNVAFIAEELLTGIFTAQAVQLSSSGTVASPRSEVYVAALPTTIGEIDVSDAIAVPGTQPTYTIAIDLYDTAVEDTTILFVHDGVTRNVVDLQRSEHADVLRNQGEARLGTTAGEFVVTYLELKTGAVGFDIFATAFEIVDGFSLAISERRTKIGELTGTGFLAESGAPIASRFSGGRLTSNWAGIGWDTGVFPATDIGGAVFSASNPAAPASQYCYGNPNSTGDRGFIRLEGDRTTTGLKTMVASSLPAFSFGFFVVGTSVAATANPGGSEGVLCLGGSVGRYSNMVENSGTIGRIDTVFDPRAISQPMGAVAGVSGQTWYFSLWHRDFVSGSSTSNFTNAVALKFE